MEITFDPEKHQYWLDGKPATSVTTVLKEFRVIDDRFFNEEARERGTYVHKATELIDQGYSILEYYEGDDYYPYIKAYCDFKSSQSFEPVWIEKKLGNLEWLIAGTADRIGILNGKEILLDIKTGAKAKSHGLQLAAYNLLDENNISRPRACLHLTSKGRWNIEPYTDPNDYAVFSGMAHVRRFWRLNGIVV